MSLNISFAGKRVLITGGASGIGRDLVKKFHEDNAVVYVVDKNEDGLKTLKAEFPNITYNVVDLRDWEATRNVIESFGRMDHLINNAALIIKQSFLEISKEALEIMMGVNFVALVNIAQIVAKGMIASNTEGTIVNISSMVDRISIDGMGAYGSTKAAVTMITKSMAAELGQYNIRVNAICPGLVNTPLLRQDATPAARALVDRSAIKRIVEPSEVGDLVYYLLSPFSAMITGDAVLIDGGITSC